MRFLLGLIVGIAITVGGAYLHDINVPADPTPAPSAVASNQIVNWSTLQAFVRDQTEVVRNAWHKLVR